MQLVEETHYKLFNWERSIYTRKEHLALITSILQDAVEQKGNIQEVKPVLGELQENTKHQGPEKGQCNMWHTETGDRCLRMI